MISYFLVIFVIVALWYGVVPIAGAFFSRYKWGLFRKRFDELRLFPLLNYRLYRQIENETVFRFTGEVESITDNKVLWVRGKDLTIPVALEKTKCFLLPKHEDDRPVELVKWNRVSALSEGVKVFIGGQVKLINNKMSFVSAKEKPLMIIFYDCDDTQLISEVIRTSRSKGEYWNRITPIALIMGSLSLIYFAISFLNRPAFRLVVITSMVALFAPILPVFPPGLLFTALYRRMTWYARKFRTYWDIARLPMRYLQNSKKGKETVILNTGEKYGFVKINCPSTAGEKIPFLLPELDDKKKPGKTSRLKQKWYFFGILKDKENLPVRSEDPFVSFGILPSHPALLARNYAVKAYAMEGLAWMVLLAGISINIIFIYLILSLLGGI